MLLDWHHALENDLSLLRLVDAAAPMNIFAVDVPG
jgi:hypothetical protein